MLAALARLGAVQNPIIPILREREVGLITKAVGTGLFITAETWRGFGHAEMARDLGLDVVSLDLESVPGDGLRLPCRRPGGAARAAGPSPACRWLYFTSGTTADPKGARHSDESVMPPRPGG